MKYKHLILPLALLALSFLSCDNSTVSRAEYDALLKEKQEMEALNDSLQFELSDMKLYVERLEEDNNTLIEELKRIP